MANVRLANDSLQKAMDAVVDDIDAGAGAGTIKIYSGTQPADGDAALSGNTLLATLTFSDPAFGATNTSGVAAASAITSDTNAAATGTATWARIQDSDAANVFDCDVGTSGATINLNSVSITSGGTVAITAFTMTHPDGV
jgi:hypothetical protein